MELVRGRIRPLAKTVCRFSVVDGAEVVPQRKKELPGLCGHTCGHLHVRLVHRRSVGHVVASQDSAW